MNKYLYLIQFELKRKLVGMIIWVIVWILLTWIMLLFFDSLSENIQDLQNLINRMPKGFTQSLGVDIDTITTIEGFVNSRLTLLSLIIGGIWAGNMGAQLIGKDENTGSLTWLVTQPITRLEIFIIKLLSLSFWVTVVNMVIVTGTIAGAYLLTDAKDISPSFFLLLGVGLSVFYLFIIAIGNLGAVIWDEDKGRNLAIFVVILNFVMNIIRAFEDAPSFVKYFTSYHYFNPDDLIKSGSLDIKILVLFVGFVLLSVVGAWKFVKRDIQKP